MSGIAADGLSSAQIQQILQWVTARLDLKLNSPTRLLPGQPLLASITPLSPTLDVSELLNGIIDFAWLQKDVLFKDLAPISVPKTSAVAGTSDVSGSTLLQQAESVPSAVAGQPFPIPSIGLAQASPFSGQLAGLVSQIAGTLALPKLSVSVKVQWVLKNALGMILSEGTDLISTGLTSPSVSILIPPIFRELRKDTIANPGGAVVCLSATVTLAVGTEPPVSVTLGPIPILQLPVLVPTVVAMFSEPNFGLTEDSAVVLLVPKHSPFSSAAPLFTELQRIEGILDELRSIASIAGFLLGLSEVVALTEAPRLRFVASDAIPKLGEIVIKHKPWYDLLGHDPNFDDAAKSLFVFGTPGTQVTFFNDTFFKTTPSSKQGFYDIKLKNSVDLGSAPDAASPLPDFFVAIRSYPTEAEVQVNPSLSNKTSPPPTEPANRIDSFELDQTGNDVWESDLSSVRFHTDWLGSVDKEIRSPTLLQLVCGSLRPSPRPVK